MVMAFMEDQQSSFKHFCRICKKGFMCGRALGGHMRAHGLGDEGGNNLDDEDPASDWDQDRENDQPANKRMYALRTNPNRLKSCRACENCGKEFVCWKSFLEHGKCSSGDGDGESPESSPESVGEEERRGCHQWSKRKRSMRTKVGSFSSKCPSSEEEDIAATCLVMLSNARVDITAADDQAEESCASASREEEKRRDEAAFVVPLSTRIPMENKAKGVATKGMFECKACKKVFNSHQALGGHRASHKKVKGCYAARLDQETNEDEVITQEDSNFLPLKSALATTFPPDRDQNSSKRKSKVHECSICHRIFSSGQALGGHKRCHWITSNSPETSKIFPPYYHEQLEQHVHNMSKWINKSDPLDLNLPVSLEADDGRLPGLRRDPRNLLSFEVSTEINLQSWTDAETEGKNLTLAVVENKNDGTNKNDISLQNHEEDEADSKVKLAKLSEMKDVNINGSSSPWLQVGIGSTATGVGPES